MADLFLDTPILNVLVLFLGLIWAGQALLRLTCWAIDSLWNFVWNCPWHYIQWLNRPL